jgi:Fe-Mn family superoxide dismutase
MTHELPALSYAFDALEPHIDARTMEIHHGKHHAAYVAKLNAALESHADLQGKSIEDLIGDLSAVPEAIRGAVRNNGGGHANHSLFWPLLTADGGEPEGDLADAINDAFGGLADLQGKVNDAGATRFGSGWAWVCVGDDGKLFVCSTANQDSPLMKGVVDQAGTPILGIDVWEHAYYLKYQNRRPDYLKAVWSVINWAKVGENFAATKA